MTIPLLPVFDSDTPSFLLSVDSAGTPVWEAVSRRAEDDDVGFAVIQEGEVTPDLPLVIWVHPGDACESDHDDEEIQESSLELQEEMGLELKQFGPCNAVVLHRVSSQYAFEDDTRVANSYYEAMCEAFKDTRVTHLFGDDLDAASAWLVAHHAPQQRPEVFLTGAWSHPEHGCVAAVGQALQAAGTVRLRVSSNSPSEPGNASAVWQPQAPSPRSLKPR